MNDQDKTLYDKAYAYFEYHAGQRTAMINFFIAVFGACVALYGTFLSSLPAASALIAGFLLVVSIVFYLIDIRNKLDVKQSQAVLCDFECRMEGEGSGSRGVFLNEERTFMLYDRVFRRTDPAYRALLRRKGKLASGTLDAEIETFVASHPGISVKDVKNSLQSACIPHLSACIRFLYFLCMSISLLGMIFAIIIACVG